MGVSFAFLILVNGRILIACVKLVAYGSLNVLVGLHCYMRMACAEILCGLSPMLISEKENGEGKTEESNDAAKDKVPFGGMHCSCILLCSLCVYV